MKSDEELKKIAEDILAGRIFCDRHCRDADEVRSSFMVIAFMKPEDLKKMEGEGVAMFYEYLSEAGPRSVNGRPIFFSAKTLVLAESEKVWEYYSKLKEAIAAVK